MPPLHLSPEIARQTAAFLQRQAASLFETTDFLRRNLARLQVAWQGGDSEAFHARAQALLLQLQTQAEALDLLAHRLAREIQEWEATDRRGADALQSAVRSAAWMAGSASLPISAGGAAFFPGWGTAIPPVITVVSIDSFLASLPAWLQSLLERLFPPPRIASPLPDDPTAGIRPNALHDLVETKLRPASEPPQASISATPVESKPPQASASAAVRQYYILHEVPVKSQGNLYGSAACSPTSVSMVLDYFHNQDPSHSTIAPEELIAAMDKGDGTPGKGIFLTNLNDELNNLGYRNITSRTNTSMEDLKNALKDGPVIVTAGVGIVGLGTVNADMPRAITGPGSVMHAMVVKGLGEGEVLVNDPWTGSEIAFSNETFSKMWQYGGNGMYVIRP